MDTTSLPFQANPHDALREGLVTLKDDARHAHPVDQIQTGLRTTVEADRMATLRNLYGSGLPARMQIERQLLSRPMRLPGLPSSRLGLESLTGELDDFGFQDFLSLPADFESLQPDLHSIMEAQLGMGRVTKPSKRGIA